MTCFFNSEKKSSTGLDQYDLFSLLKKLKRFLLGGYANYLWQSFKEAQTQDLQKLPWQPIVNKSSLS